MITAALIITAWAAAMPLWASVAITVIAGIRLEFKLAVAFGRFAAYGKGEDVQHG